MAFNSFINDPSLFNAAIANTNTSSAPGTHPMTTTGTYPTWVAANDSLGRKQIEKYFAQKSALAQMNYIDAQDAAANVPSLNSMIASRMRWGFSGTYNSFGYLHAHRLGERVIVFGCTKDDHFTLEDEWSLFPSDMLITQLRLLENK